MIWKTNAGVTELLLLPLLSIDIDVAGAASIGSRNKAEQSGR